MFDKFSLAAGVLALLVFTYAQQQGWDLFDDVANSRHGSNSSSGRSYHK